MRSYWKLPRYSWKRLTWTTIIYRKPSTLLSVVLPGPGCVKNVHYPSHVNIVGKSALGRASYDEPTIYALSTAPGKSAIAIIRISGPACLTIYHGLCRGKPPKPRQATIRTLYHPHEAGEVLDSQALILHFPAPKTATGEDVLELHVHGGTAVIRSVLDAIPLVPAIKQGSSGVHIIRYAEPGEFSRRAFYNNRLDLTQIEALGDTLAAQTEQQRRIAVRGNSSVLSQRYESWRQQLLYARGELEALIDFSEDQHFDESPAKLVTSVTEQVLGLQRQIKAAMENASRGEFLRNGISLALLGAPNAGKSSLLNQIVGREAAIVSEEAGTTRDVIDVGVDVGGFYCTFGDLAGLRTKSVGSQFDVGLVEQEGMKRARERALVADVIIVLVPIERRQSGDGTWQSHLELNAEIAATLKLCDIRRQKVVYTINKIDLIGPNEDTAAMQGLMQQQLSDQDLPAPALPILAVSCKSCQQRSQDYGGLHPLLASLTGLFQDMTATSKLDPANWESSLGASHRQRILLEQCSNELRNYLDQINRDSIDHDLDDDGVDVVLAAECLRSAADYLAKITGKGQVANIEEVLGVVFEKFCVGK